MNTALTSAELVSDVVRPTNWISRASFACAGLVIVSGLVLVQIPILIGSVLGCVVAFASVFGFVFLAGAMGTSGKGSGLTAVLLLLFKIPILVLVLLFLNTIGAHALGSFAVAVVLVYSGAVANLGYSGMRRRHFFDRHG